MSKKKTEKKPKPQQELPIKGPGVEALEIAEIDKAAGEYVSVRDRRMKLTEDEVQLREELKMAMHRHEKELARNAEGELLYRYNDMIVRLKPGEEKISVKSALTSEEVD